MIYLDVQKNIEKYLYMSNLSLVTNLLKVKKGIIISKCA